jgi:hypothetical protein
MDVAADRECMDTPHLLSVSVTPVVLISACGLVTLALYNRLGAIHARIRGFHQQKIVLLKEAKTGECAERRQMMDMLDSQIDKVTIKAKVIQNSLYCLLSAILAFLFCSLLTAATELRASIGMVALGMHVVGVILFIAGIGWAIRELTMSLTPLEEESACLEVLTTHYKARPGSRKTFRVAKRA